MNKFVKLFGVAKYIRVDQINMMETVEVHVEGMTEYIWFVKILFINGCSTDFKCNSEAHAEQCIEDLQEL